ncbi:MAG: hypothetical protein HYZ53_24820 [Planctomycetes bacterium]|nr:hypothetical protein [Planctomycetota bacterium]
MPVPNCPKCGVPLQERPGVKFLKCPSCLRLYPLVTDASAAPASAAASAAVPSPVVARTTLRPTPTGQSSPTGAPGAPPATVVPRPIVARTTLRPTPPAAGSPAPAAAAAPGPSGVTKVHVRFGAKSTPAVPGAAPVGVQPSVIVPGSAPGVQSAGSPASAAAGVVMTSPAGATAPPKPIVTPSRATPAPAGPGTLGAPPVPPSSPSSAAALPPTRATPRGFTAITGNEAVREALQPPTPASFANPDLGEQAAKQSILTAAAMATPADAAGSEDALDARTPGGQDYSGGAGGLVLPDMDDLERMAEAAPVMAHDEELAIPAIADPAARPPNPSQLTLYPLRCFANAMVGTVYLLSLVTAVIVLLSLLYLVAMRYIGSYPQWVALAFIFAMLFMGTVAQALLIGLRMPEMPEPGLEIDLKRHPRLHMFVRGASSRIRTRVPERVYLVLAGMSSAYEVPRLFGLLPGERILCIAFPTINLLTVDEFRATVGHELGHLGRTNNPLESISLHLKNTLSRVVTELRKQIPWGNPVFWYSSAVLNFYIQMEKVRERMAEFVNDNDAALMVGGEAFAKLLVRMTTESVIFNNYAAKIRSGQTQTIPAGVFTQSYRVFRGEVIGLDFRKKVLDELLGQRATGLATSRPSFGERLAFLRSLPPEPEEERISAVWLFQDFPEVEKRMNEYAAWLFNQMRSQEKKV